METIYQAWDEARAGGKAMTFAALGQAWDEARAGDKGMAFAAFARKFLLDQSSKTRLPLNGDQVRILVEIVDSFVEGAQERHLKSLGNRHPLDEAARDLVAEFKTPLFTRKEIEGLVRDGSNEFAGLSQTEIRDRLNNRNGFFKRLKTRILSQCSVDFGEELKPYLEEADRAEAERIFSVPIGRTDKIEVSTEAVADLANVRSALARGNRVSELGLKDDDSSDPETAATAVPACVLAAFSGKLLTNEEKLLRKLTAVYFLAVRLVAGDDEEAALPFLALGAAQFAYDFVTERKAAYQLAGLGSALEELEPGEVCESTKEADHDK